MKKYFLPFFKNIEFVIDSLVQDFLDSNQIKLTLNEINVLEIVDKLKKTNSNTTTNVAALLNLSPSAISITVKKLEGKNIIFRHHDVDDRRVVYITLTSNTLQLLEKVIARRDYFLMKHFEGIDNTEEKVLISLLAKINSNSKQIYEKKFNKLIK